MDPRRFRTSWARGNGLTLEIITMPIDEHQQHLLDEMQMLDMLSPEQEDNQMYLQQALNFQRKLLN